MPALTLAIRLVLAAVLGVAGAAKLRDAEGSRAALERFGVDRRAARIAGPLLPWAELLTAIGLLMPALAWWGTVSATVLLSTFAVAVGLNLRLGRTPDCHCFGNLHSGPVGRPTLVRNAGLALLGVVALWGGTGDELSPFGWLAHLRPVELGLVGADAALVVLVGALVWFLVELLRQNGRVLARVARLEQRLNQEHAAARVGTPAPDGRVAVGGLPTGAPAPDFELTTAAGGRVFVRALCDTGLPVVLVFSDPGCAPCNALLPQLAAWARTNRGTHRLAVITRDGGPLDRGRIDDLGLAAHVLLQSGGEVAAAYRVPGTPSAVLLDASGCVAGELALGADAIAALVGSLEAGDGATRPAARPRGNAIEVLELGAARR